MSEPERKVLTLVPGRRTVAETGPFPIGAKVRMGGTGPVMIVQTPGEEWTQCTWFDKRARVGPEAFRNGTLQLANKKRPVSKRRPRK